MTINKTSAEDRLLLTSGLEDQLDRNKYGVSKKQDKYDDIPEVDYDHPEEEDINIDEDIDNPLPKKDDKSIRADGICEFNLF